MSAEKSDNTKGTKDSTIPGRETKDTIRKQLRQTTHSVYMKTSDLKQMERDKSNPEDTPILTHMWDGQRNPQYLLLGGLLER